MAEELLLLAYRPRGTPSVNLEMLDYTLSAAVLAELIIQNRVTLENGHLRVRAPEPTGDTELDETLQRLATHPGPPPAFGDWWISMYTPERRSRLLARLVQRGVMTAETRRYLRIFKEEVFPDRDPRPRESLHDRLRTALSGGRPDARASAFVSLAHACRVLPAFLSAEERRRAKEITARDPVGALVSQSFAQAAREASAGSRAARPPDHRS